MKEAHGLPERVWLLLALAYAALCLAVWVTSWRYARRALASFEARSQAGELATSTSRGKDRNGSAEPGVYRGPAAVPRLMTGCLPRPEQVWAIAYLRGGLDAVEELILARAFVEGLLLADSPPAILPGMIFRPGATTVVHVPSADAVLSEFQRALGPYTKRTDGTVRVMAEATATGHLAKLEAEVVSSRLKLRHVPWAPISIVGVPSALLVGLGLFCLFASAMPATNEAASRSQYVVSWAMIAIAIAAVIVLRAFFARTTTTGTDYVRWLDTALPTVDLTQGSPPAEDAALAMAVRGWEVLKGDPRLPFDFYSRFVEGPPS